MTPDDELLLRLDRESQQRTERVREMLRDAGREDLLADFDQKIREIRSGVAGAQSAWHSISGKQRWVLERVGQGRELRRSLRLATTYDAYPITGAAVTHGVILDACRLSTARALCAHELLHVAGGALDPEAKFVITERGQFVLKHGRPL